MDCKLNLGQLSLILFKKSYLYISKKLNRSYLTLICLLIINNFTIAQIEFNDSIWSDLKTNDMSNIIDLPVSDEESKLLLRKIIIQLVKIFALYLFLKRQI